MAIPTNQAELTKAVLDYKSWKLQNFQESFDKKVASIAAYLTKHSIKDVVVGISGGIDSAVVVGLLLKVKETMPLDIHCYTINFSLYDSIFESKYIQDIKHYCNNGVSYRTVDASKGFNALMDDMKVAHGEQHIRAQSSYALRYQMLFTYGQVFNAVTVGTTNRDEFEYAGWFGKNSDMVVDLQVITDWHKFEVVKAAKLMDIPESIINRAPVGDLLDRSTDEENFGCTYDELALFSRWLHPFVNDNEFMVEKFAKLRALHKKNAHKYQGQNFNPVFIK